MVCWRFSPNGTTTSYKRIYHGPALSEIDAGYSHICGLVAGTNRLQCWQWRRFNSTQNHFVSSIAVGKNFVCGLLKFGKIQCQGNYSSVTNGVPSGNYSVVAAGFRHACGISLVGSLECWGEMVGEKPRGGVFKSLALGENRTCAIRFNGTAVCWGEIGFDLPNTLQQNSFEAIEANRGVFCGIATSNFSLYCWGNAILDSNPFIFGDAVPGPCKNQCPCNPYPNYGRFCSQGLKVCEPCSPEPSNGNWTLVIPEPVRPSKKSGGSWNRKMVAFLVVGCVGSLSMGIACFVLFFRYFTGTRGSSRVHDSGPLDEIEIVTPPEQNPVEQVTQAPQAQQAPPVLEKRLSQMFSMGNGGNLEEFTFPILLQATNNFSDEHKIGSGSFGSVYRATLQDGREVAIKRAELSSYSSGGGGGGTAIKRQDDNKNAFVNELECLSRLNHKNLVRLLGFCEDCCEYALVYEYMNNGSLHDHLHNPQNPQSSDIMSWPARIQVALDAARGIEYLHVYTVPPIIHRDIKSSNILLNATWTAKVSDFGLSLMGPQENVSHLSLHAAGTVGYIDPEYFRLQQLTTKSDVYSFGVLLLELLSGYKAIHLNEKRMPRNVVDYVVPYIIQDDIHRVLDPKVPSPTPFEIEAVAYIGYLAADCVTLEGQDRPTMTEIVNSLERALVACLAMPVFSRSTSNSSL